MRPSMRWAVYPKHWREVMSWKKLIALLAILAMFAAACGDDDDDSGTADGGTDTEDTDSGDSDDGPAARPTARTASVGAREIMG